TPRSRCSRSLAAAGATTATVSPGLSALGLIGLRFTLVRPASYQKVRANAHQFGELRHLLAPLDQSSVPAPAGAACSAISVSEPTSEKPSSAAVTHKPAAPIAIVGRSPIIPPANPATSCPASTLPRLTNRKLALTRPSIAFGVIVWIRLTALMKYT